MPEWKDLVPDFTYHGSNCYAFLLAKYGQTSVGVGGGGGGDDGGNDEEGALVQCKLIDTFDLVVYQLYESYSHSNYHVQVHKGSLSGWVTDLVRRMERGWMVHFSGDEELGFEDSVVKVPPQKLLIGLANAWAHGSEKDSAVRGIRKTLFARPLELQQAVAQLQEDKTPLRGFAFWSLVHGLSTDSVACVSIFRGMDVVVYSLSFQRVHTSLSPALHASLLPEGDHIPADADGDSSRPTQAFYMASNSQKSSVNMVLLYRYTRSLTFENLCQAEELNAVLRARRWSPEVMIDAAARGGAEVQTKASGVRHPSLRGRRTGADWRARTHKGQW
jgi:hypothetical protein